MVLNFPSYNLSDIKNMDSVNIVQNFTLPGDICRKLALDWSSDNKISICTDKAIYIMTSHCSPVETGFPPPLHKQVIRAPTTVMDLGASNVPLDIEDMVQSVDEQENLFNLFLDHTLTPQFAERNQPFLGYRCAKWSPKGAARAGRCLLATLTMDHRLALYEEKDKEWKFVWDLSEMMKTMHPAQTFTDELKNYVKDAKLAVKQKQIAQSMMNNASGSDSESVSDHTIDTIEEKRGRGRPKGRGRGRGKAKAKAKGKSKAKAPVPLPPEKKKKVKKHKRKDISQFEDHPALSSYLNFSKMKDGLYKLAAMEITWTGMFGSPATSMTDSSYEYCYLIVAMKSGHIQFWKISPNDGKMVSLTYEWDTGLELLTSICWQQTSPTSGFLMCGSWKGILAFLPVSVRTSEGDQEPKLVVKEMCEVWNEEDNVAVDHISVLKTALKKYVIIAAKQHALVACEIVLTDASIIIRNVGHSFGLHKLPITGMCVIDSNMPQYRILLTTMEGLVVEIKVSVGNDEITFHHEKVNIDLDFEHYMTQGLAVSGNGILCALIMKTCVYYDHIGIKEPLRFALFVTKPYEEIYTKLKSVLKPQFSFMPAASNTISKHSDFLECIRINLASNTPLPDWMTSFLDKDPNSYESLSQLELYFLRFLLNSYVSGLAVAAPKHKGNLELKLFTVDAIIMRNYISKVFGSCQDKIDLLTPAQGQSLLLMADWLFKEFQMPVDSLYTALGFETPEDPESLPAREVCRICKGDVKLDSVKTGQCEKNHMFGRCCQSLLLCDVIPYNQCNSCKSVALQDVWNFGLVCTYCGMIMT